MNWNYIAGFFDGEGSVSTMNFSHRVGLQSTVVTLAQSGTEGLAVLTCIRDFLWAVGIKGYIQKAQRRVPHREMHYYKISARPSVVAFLAAVLPLVYVKRVVVQDTLRFYRLFPPTLRALVTIERNRERGKYGAVNLDPVQLHLDRKALGTLKAVAAKYGVNTYTIKKYLDPDYRARYDQYRKTWRAKKAAAALAAAAA